MSIRKKTLLVIFITIIALFIAVYFIASASIMHGFASVENNDTHQHIDRVIDGIQSKANNIHGLLDQLGQWDDTYKFIVDRNQAYVTSNLTYELAIKPTGLNMLFYLNNNVDIVAKLLMDYTNGHQIPLPATLLQYLQKGSRLVTHADKSDFVIGIITIDNKPLLIVSRPIMPSKNEGPIHGTIVAARYIDAQFVKDVASITHENVALYSYQSISLPSDFALAKKYLIKTSDVYIHPLSDNQIVGYRTFPDIAGNPGIIVRTILPRVIYQRGKHTVYIFTIIFAITTIVLALIMLILLEQTVLIRLLRLYKTVLTIGKNRDIKARVPLSGRDEIGTLGKAINTMLDSLSAAIVGKRESQERFKNIADSAPILIWMAGADKKCTYVNKMWLAFTGRSLEQEVGDGWQEAIHADDKTDFLAGYASVFEKQVSYEKEIRLKKADGQYRWISIRIVPNTKKDKTLIGCLGAGTDITDLKESTGQVERINKLLASREIALGELKKENQELKGEKI